MALPLAASVAICLAALIPAAFLTAGIFVVQRKLSFVCLQQDIGTHRCNGMQSKFPTIKTQ
jgi:hypothetical protein